MSKIMLAEDDAMMVSLLKTLLALEGFQTVTLFENDDLLAALERESPDVLMLDIHLTQGNGIDFLRRLRADSRFTRLVVIMASGMDLREECLTAGANIFLLKPFMPDDLIQAIRAQL
ncbi:response regulator [bacterium]|nr:response regulator [bacterium]NCT20629.1 response regulator [bacterium]OIO85674.1 MAG: hypothetical protein AUK01_05495 [Anaerolineae bacterium CG2_30_57_67]